MEDNLFTMPGSNMFTDPWLGYIEDHGMVSLRSSHCLLRSDCLMSHKLCTGCLSFANKDDALSLSNDIAMPVPDTMISAWIYMQPLESALL